MVRFISFVVLTLGSNLGDENFGVKELAAEASMKYYQINRRIKGISRKSTSRKP